MRYSTDLLTWTELNASVPAQGERTTATDTDTDTAAAAKTCKTKRKP